MARVISFEDQDSDFYEEFFASESSEPETSEDLSEVTVVIIDDELSETHIVSTGTLIMQEAVEEVDESFMHVTETGPQRSMSSVVEDENEESEAGEYEEDKSDDEQEEDEVEEALLVAEVREELWGCEEHEEHEEYEEHEEHEEYEEHEEHQEQHVQQIQEEREEHQGHEVQQVHLVSRDAFGDSRYHAVDDILAEENVPVTPSAWSEEFFVESPTKAAYPVYFERITRNTFLGDNAWKLSFSPFRLKLFGIFEVLIWTNNVAAAIKEISGTFPSSPKKSAIYLELWDKEWEGEIPDSEHYQPETFEKSFWEDLFWWFIQRGYNNRRLQETLFELIRVIKETNLGSIQADDGARVQIFEISPSFPHAIEKSMRAYDAYSKDDSGISGERACLTASGLYARLAHYHMSTRATVWGYALLAEFAEDMNEMWKQGQRFVMIRAASLLTMLQYAGEELHKYVSDMKDKPLDAHINETPGHDFVISRMSTWLRWSANIEGYSLNGIFDTEFRFHCLNIHHLMKQIHIQALWTVTRGWDYSFS
ncbi:hypothetical protein MNAN1_002787 [Malassezia nana]|uniref:Uncharacterized protein n=1 Tax=Malassezia nana TaxID=180528 RepID=A0AAF0ESZ7_9BASI|nr:hypothetical protein MNAN1_002787 [Malassezia nana]